MKTKNQISTAAGQTGSIAVAVTVAVAVLLILCGSILTLSNQSKNETSAAITRSQALHAADAGIAHAIVNLTAGQEPAEGLTDAIGDANNPISFGGGNYFAQVLANADKTFTVTSTAFTGSEGASVEAVLTPVGGSIYDNAVFAGNSSGDALYALQMGGSAGQADNISGDIFSGGDVNIVDDALVVGSIRAGGSISGASGEEGVYQPIPDLAAEDYANTADFDVAALFNNGTAQYKYASAGGYAYQMPESSPAHIFRKNPSDRTADTSTTVKNDYFFEDPYETVTSDSGKDGSNAYRMSLSGISGEPGVSSNKKVFFIDGNLWIHSKKSFSLGIKHSESDGVQVTFVVSGNIYFADNFFYEDDSKDGIAFIAMKDAAEPDSGNVYFGDPVFGTLQKMQSFMYAENNFYDLNLDASGSQVVEVFGNMTAGNQVLVQRDYYGSHTKLKVDFDERIMTGGLDMPGLPGASAGSKKFIVTYWHQIARQ